MNIFVPGKVYENLVKMMGYRGVTLTNQPHDVDSLVKELNHYEFTMISGTRSDSDIRGAATVIIILITPNSKYANKSDNFKKLLKEIPKVANDHLNVIFISELPFTVHIKKILSKHKEANINTYFEDYDYEKFTAEMPKHELVPVHTIATDDEVEEFCNKYYTTKDKFPRIQHSETQAVWLGLRPGMVVKITRMSETAGTAITYRICI